MRAVTTGTAAFALGIPKKELDNILSRYEVRGFVRGTRGLARRISFASIEQVAVAIDLTRAFSIPVASALQLAEQALGSREGIVASPDDHLALHADLARIRHGLQERLHDAIEHVIPPRRGRPPLKD